MRTLQMWMSEHRDGLPVPEMRGTGSEATTRRLVEVKVLAVDDDPANLAALEMMLDSMPVELIKARCGDDALKHLLDHDFALILRDVQMPNLDGFETAALVRQRERTHHVPIVFLTAAY